MNRLSIIGRLTHEPELRSVNTANGPVNVCSISIAVNSRRKNQNGQDETTFFRASCWNGLADVASRYLHKGSQVYVSGEVSVRTYTANDGTFRASMEIRVNDLELLGSRNDNAGNGNYAAPAAAPAPTAQNVGFTNISDDDLPF